ncbi:hypothetical protein DLAC_05193 [Tieghemostelium lacteum]|uniref:Cytochrome c oxidase subunit n=1 Tax=Tieghemostelium lacteum TaxID=361077 RepID=A0A151ZIH7_TIELA|nr:hypothetical protein DLAC_05193 [Tieghemostelium lacteum]|eukprot:KYQ93798.1 hypothetical protein DLAC_05193 [Tieghemostelium lacteum]
MENIETAPYNPRFPNQNQTKHCWANYVDYNGCVKHYGGDESKCLAFKQAYTSLCPTAWVTEWDEYRSSSIFPSSRV